MPHAKNGWKFTLDAISRYYDRVFADAAQGHSPLSAPPVGPLKLPHHPAYPAKSRNMSKPIWNPRGCWESGPPELHLRAGFRRSRAANFRRSR